MRDSPHTLAKLWRRDAAILRSRAAEPQAALLEQCADELEQAFDALSRVPVGLDEAVTLTGFTRGHLMRLVKNGKLKNIGTDKSPEFLGFQLPRKPGHGLANNILAPGEDAPANYEWQAARAVLFKG